MRITANTEYEAASYRPTRASAATKSDTPLIDTPTSVTVLTAALIRDQFAQTSAEVLRNSPAVSRWGTSGNVGGTHNSSVRGFYTGAVYKDGQRINMPGHLFLDNIETIEVLKGPASVLYGSIQPGGMIAYSRKKPQTQQYRAVSMTLGSESYKKLSTDLAGALTPSGELQYRLVAAGVDTDLFIDHTFQETTFVAPSLRYEAHGWLVDAGYEYGRDKSAFGYDTLPLAGDKPDESFSRSILLTHPDNFRKQNEDTAHVQVTRKLAENSSVTASYLHSKFIHESVSYRSSNAYDPQTQVYRVTGTVILPTRNNDEDAFELRGEHDWSLGGLRNALTLGAEARQRFSEYRGCSAYFLDPPWAYDSSAQAPDYSRSPLDLPRGCVPDDSITYYDGTESEQKERALYVQNTSWLTDNLQVLAGLRYARIETDNRNITQNTSTEQKDSATTGRLGLLYKTTPALSLYASYSESFEQLVGRRFDGGTFDPTEGDQIEAGFKHEIGTAAFLTGSVFRIEQTNLTIPDLANPGFSVQEGKVRSEGVELEISGDVLPRLGLSGGVMYMDNEVVGGANDGRRMTNSYRVKASLWANYYLKESWTLGAGVFHHGNSYVNAQNSKEIPSATLVDAALTYQTPAWGGLVKMQFNVKNVFDEWDYTGGFGTGNSTWIYREPGRQFYASIGYEF